MGLVTFADRALHKVIVTARTGFTPIYLSLPASCFAVPSPHSRFRSANFSH
jgi:hypothetical protein